MIEDDQVVLVDPEDRVLGTAPKMLAHEQGLLHRAFSVFIFHDTEKGRDFLLQKRHPQKYHCGGLWTNACCSHPRLNEAVMIAAHRRLQEELRINLPLKAVGQFQYCAHFENGLTEHELDHVFVGSYDAKKMIVPDPLEISELRWVQVDDLLTDLNKCPTRYTPWFAEAFALVLEDLC